MPQVSIPSATTFRRRLTRTYDAGNNDDQTLAAILQLICPAGTLIPTLLIGEPGDGWKLCNGQTLSKVGYPRLYDAIGGAFGETATTFNLPDLSGRFPMGAGGAVSLLAFGGSANVTLTSDQMPPHTHAVSDPGHGHTFTGAPHSHGVTDAGHSHSSVAGATDTAAAGTDVDAVTGGTTGTATTGITVNAATTGGSISDEETGITVASTGGGGAVDIRPPFIAVNWMVRT